MFKPVTQRHDKVLIDKRKTKIVNGSTQSGIDCFERMTPQEAIRYFNL